MRKRPVKYTKPRAFFSHYDNYQLVEVNPDPPAPGDDPKPFHVLIRSTDHIPVSLLVFAKDADTAGKRVLKALHTVAEKRKHNPVLNHCQRYLDELESGELKMFVEPYDTARMCAKVIWADNGGI